MQCVICLNTSMPAITSKGIGSGLPALTPLKDVDCIPRVGEHIDLLERGTARHFRVVRVTYSGTDTNGLAGCVVVVEEIEQV